MKRTMLATLAVLAAAPAFAQAPNYQPIRVDFTVYGAYAPGDVRSFGMGAALEPKFNLTDNVAVGLRLEGAGMVSEDIGVGPGSVSIGARGVTTILAKADYYVGGSWARPFVGVGAGFYRIGTGSQSIDAGSGSIVQRAEAFKGFGFCPQVGLNLGGFRLAGTYHIVTGGKQVVATQAVGATVPEETSLSKSFFAFEIGGTFGGGRRPQAIEETPAAAPAQ